MKVAVCNQRDRLPSPGANGDVSFSSQEEGGCEKPASWSGLHYCVRLPETRQRGTTDGTHLQRGSVLKISNCRYLSSCEALTFDIFIWITELCFSGALDCVAQHCHQISCPGTTMQALRERGVIAPACSRPWY